MAQLAALVGTVGIPAVGPESGRGMLQRLLRLDCGSDRHLDRIGIQLYTVRHLMEKDAAGTVAALAEIGYTEVELAGLYGMTAQAMRDLLDSHRMRAVSSHHGLDEMRRKWPAELEEAKTLGQTYIGCSSIGEAERSVEGFKTAAIDLNRLGEEARAQGLQLAYHNHQFEFQRVGGTVLYDILLDNCDSRFVAMEADLMHMTHGGGDPIAYFKSHPGRFPLVHVKDQDRNGEMVDVGKGTIDFRAIFALSEQAGIKHYFVEHDEPPAPIADARICYEYLRQLTF